MKMDHKSLRILMSATQIGTLSVTAILLGLGIGVYLDSVFHNALFIVIFTVLGMIAAFKAVADLLKSLLK